MQLNLNNMYKFLEITGNAKPFHAMACLFLILFYAATVYAQPSKAVDEKNLRNPPLLFLGNQKLPPMIYMKDDKTIGIIVDIAEALKSRMNRPVRLDYMNWSQAQQLVLEGKADALLQINSSEERKKIYDFSDTLLESEFSIFTSSDRKDVFDSAGLRGLQVGVEEKGLPIQILKRDPLIKIVVIPDITSGFHLLADGGVDAVVVDRWVGLFVVAENNLRKIKITGEAIDKSSSAIAVKKGNTKLLADINKALAEIKDDGTYTKILAKWESKEIVYQTKDQYFKQKIILTATLCVLLIMIIAGIFLLFERKKRSRAEKLLQEREKKYEHLFNNAEVGMCRARLDGSEVLEINRRFLDIVGMTLEETLGKPSINFWSDPKDREEMVKKLVADGSVSAFEHKILNKRQNEVRNCLTSIRLYRDQGILEGSILDITDRKRTEEALQQAHDELEHRVVMRTKELMQVNEILRSEITERRQAEHRAALMGFALNNVQEAVYLVDENARFHYVNEESCRILGYTHDELLSLSVPDIDPDFPLERWPDHWNDLKTRNAITFECRHKTKDGHIILGEISTNYFEYDGQSYNLALVRNITERKQTEEALRQSEAKLGDATRIAHVGYWDRDYIAESITLSDEACRIFGLPLQNRLPKLTEWHSQWLKLIHPDDQPKVAQAVTEALAGGPPYNVDYRVVRSDGEVRSIHSYAEVKRDGSGRPLHMFGTMIDITERKKAEEAIRKLNQELEERVADRTAQLKSANKELEAFAYSVSHDLRAPLRGIDGFSQILLEEYQDRMDEQGKDYLNRVRSAAQHMAQLIDNLLGLSRISRSDMAIGQVDLSRMVREIADDLHKTDPGRRVSFVIQEGIKVQGDVLLLGIVLKNLLQNAWKFTSKHPRAQIEFGMQQQKGTPVYFIRDDGAGFDMKYADKLFGAFQRLHTAKEFPGTGVGLATVQRIIHRHGGRIWAKGEVEKGAVFHFII